MEAARENGINKLLKKMQINFNDSANVYHNAKLLLKIYSSAVWNTRDTIDELLCSCSEAYQTNDIAGLESLVSMYENKDVQVLEGRLRSVAQNKIIIDIVEKSMVHVKEYPAHGELYYDILSKNFFVKFPYTESEILESLNISRSTYYRRRKEAITTFGVSLWGYILPNILRALTNTRNETFLRQN